MDTERLSYYAVGDTGLAQRCCKVPFCLNVPAPTGKYFAKAILLAGHCCPSVCGVMHVVAVDIAFEQHVPRAVGNGRGVG